MARAMGCGLRRRRVACSLARSSVKSSVVRPDVVKMAARSVGTSDSSMWRSAAMRTCIRSACEICTSSKKYKTTGHADDPTALAWRFSPVSNEKRDRVKPGDELRVLVATDVHSEGQNLQNCAIVVNFDLPWA